jgi:hypothetical protein
MCKVWLIYYTCGHKLTERLSKCRATFKSQSAPGKAFYPACQGTASLNIDFKRPCGDCARRKREEELNEKLTQFATGAPEQIKAEEEYWHEEFVLSTTFPRLEHKKSLKPLKIHLPTSQIRGSLLKTEVLREDIKEDVSEILSWEAYYASWRTGPSNASGTEAEVQSWESEDANETEGSTTEGWASDDTFAFEQTTIDPWAANDGNTQHTDLGSTRAWGGEHVIDVPPASKSQSPTEVLSQQETFRTTGDWIEDTAEKVDGLGRWKNIHNGEKEGRDAAFCALIDSLTQSFSDRLLLSTGMV